MLRIAIPDLADQCARAERGASTDPEGSSYCVRALGKTEDTITGGIVG